MYTCVRGHGKGCERVMGACFGLGPWEDRQTPYARRTFS